MSVSINREIGSGVYLVIDPSMDESVLLSKLEQCLKENLAAVQIWDNFDDWHSKSMLINRVCELCQAQNVPVLINNKWELLNDFSLDGVHFDEIPKNYAAIKETINKPFISGLTCNNDLEYLRWASENNLDYISFCSIFPSSTANSCELVDFKTIKQAALQYSIPIFLAGGITPENLNKLKELHFSGIAVVSGVMSSDRPGEAIKKYQEKLNFKHQ